MMILLIPCKICGSRPTRGTGPKRIGKGKLYYIECQCGHAVTAETHERAAAEWNRANLPGERGCRIEKCVQCGGILNVSEKARLIQGKVYVCPKCEAKNRKVRHGV